MRECGREKGAFMFVVVVVVNLWLVFAGEVFRSLLIGMEGGSRLSDSGEGRKLFHIRSKVRVRSVQGDSILKSIG